MTRPPTSTAPPRRTRALVVHPAVRGAGDDARLPEARLDEASGLAEAIALDVVLGQVVPVRKPRPATFLGKGAVDHLTQVVEDQEVDVAIFDGQLSPVQQRNLEKAWQTKVIDRTALILEIFGERAQTKEGVLQVELAHLTYQRSRLVRSWTHLERQRGGLGFIGGPGETQIELDRRLIGERIAKLKKELEEVARTRELHRKARRKVPYPVVALVGYTNAGKSTLFNRLTTSDVMAEDLLFATLDPTMRGLVLPSGRKVILSDTVGFVSDLPHELVAAFRATLEEVLEADLLVHVRDVSHPDSDSQRADVETVLSELGVGHMVQDHMIEALNKTDLLPSDQHSVVMNRAERSDRRHPVSALTGEGIAALIRHVDERLAGAMLTLTLDVPLTDGATIAWLYAHGDVEARQDDEETARVTLKLDPADVGRLEQRLGRSLG